MISYEVKNRFSGAVQFTAEIDCEERASVSIKLGLAVKWALKADANLADANLADAYLADANLARANLADANLAGANLAGANLAGANLADANLARANLAGANLADANLARTYLAGAYLADANLARAKDAELAIARTRILPDGELIGWKKCGTTIVKLKIPAEAKRSHAFGRKCRAEYVDVLEVFGADVAETSTHGPRTEYRVGQRVMPDKFDDNWQDECSNGIHFFITRAEAEAY